MEPRPPSLRRFLLARILWLLLPIIAALMAVHWYVERRLLLGVFDQSLEERAMTLATLVTNHTGRIELEFADEYMPQYSRAESPMFFQIWLPDGSVLERSVSLGGRELPRRYGSLAEPRSFWTDLGPGQRLRAIGIEFPLRLGTDPARNPATSVVVVVAAGEAELGPVLAKGTTAAVVTGTLAAGGVVLVVVLALRRGIRLLEGVGGDVERLAHGSLVGPVDLEGTPREIRPIAERLNRAMASIAALIERERRFNADAAHELRTPLSELKAAIDVGLKWPDQAALGAALQECRAITRRMEVLVESLLHLSRLESGDRVEQRPVDLALLLRSEIERAQSSAGGSRDLSFDGPEHLSLATSPVLWEVIARNLVENALAHATPGSPIEASLSAAQGGARFEVKNRVEGFDESMAARCAERFWRKDAAGADGEHFGLGLSIVSAACERLGHRFRSSYANGVFGAHVEPLPPASGAAAQDSPRP